MPLPPKARSVATREPSTLDAVRVWLAKHSALLARHHAGAVRNGDPEHIHDLRTASRHILSLLDAFAGQLAPTRAAARRAALSRLAAPLGTLRDTQVWLAFIRSPRRLRRYADDPDWSAYLEAQLRREAGEIRDLRRGLAATGWRRLLADLRLLTERDIPRLAARRRAIPLRPFAARAVRRSHERLLAMEIPDDADELHEFRKRCRVARYLAEHFGETLGPAVRKLARRLKAVTDALGLHHDMHVHLRRIRKELHRPPDELTKLMKRERRRAERDFAKAWRGVRCRKLRRALDRGFAPGRGAAAGRPREGGEDSKPASGARDALLPQ